MSKVAGRPSVLAKRGMRAFGNRTIKVKANCGAFRIWDVIGRRLGVGRGYNVSYVAPGRMNEGSNVPKRPNNV